MVVELGENKIPRKGHRNFKQICGKNIIPKSCVLTIDSVKRLPAVGLPAVIVYFRSIGYVDWVFTPIIMCGDNVLGDSYFIIIFYRKNTRIIIWYGIRNELVNVLLENNSVITT